MVLFPVDYISQYNLRFEKMYIWDFKVCGIPNLNTIYLNMKSQTASAVISGTASEVRYLLPPHIAKIIYFLPVDDSG